MEEVITSRSESETEKTAKRFVRSLENSSKNLHVVALRGELGVGKTVFAKGVAEFLGVKKNVTSPTFVIWKKYETSSSRWKYFIHADLYRVNTEQELVTSGLEKEFKNESAIIVVEWPEKIKMTTLKKSICVEIKHGKKENERVIKYAT